jgi:hypothetical protein
MAAKKHARLGPSTFKPREICPSFESDQEESAASKRGDLLHDLLEQYGYKAKTRPEIQQLDDRDIYQLDRICDYTEPFERRKGVKIHRELELDLSQLEIDGCDLGTVDLLIIQEKLRIADLMDYKLGWFEVDDAEVNIQQWIYVLGVFQNFEVDQVTVHILQPGRDEVSAHTFSRDDVDRLLLRARTIAARVNSKRKVYNPVYSNCLWCDAKAECPALHKLVLKAQDLVKLDLPDDLKDLDDPAHFGTIYEAVDIIVKWAYQMKDRISQYVVDGNDVVGYHLITKNGKRSIIDAGLAREILMKKWLITEDEFLTIIDISITELNKLVRSKAPRGEKEKRSIDVINSLGDEGIVVSTAATSYLAKN